MTSSTPNESAWSSDPERLRRAREALAAAEASAFAAAGDGAAAGADAAGAAPRLDAGRSSRQARPWSAVEAGAGAGGGAGPAVERGRVRPAAKDDGDDEGGEEAKARQVVLKQLAMAPRSRAQLEKKLAAKEIDPDVAAAVLDRFTEVGLVDDAAFAEALVRSQRDTRGLARRGLAHELRKKGVDRDIADDALASVDRESERARAEELVAARLKRLHGLDRAVQMRRLGGMLARKGYPADLSFAVIRDALDNAPEHSRD